MADRTTAPWDYSIAKPGEATVANLPTPEGAALGRELARLTDIEEARQLKQFPDMLPRCDDCAFRLGTVPNQCEDTLMDAIKCTIENDVFYCHKGVKNEREPKRMCAGYALMVTARFRAEKEKNV